MKKSNKEELCESEIISSWKKEIPEIKDVQGAPISESEFLTQDSKKEKTAIKIIKAIFKRYFIDAFTGMAQGLFVTLIAGTILCQIANWIGLNNGFGQFLNAIGSVAKMLMGAGIGVGIAHYWKSQKLVIFSAAVVGMVGAFSSNILNVLNGATFTIAMGAPGNPIAAYVVSILCIELIGKLVAGRTKVDIILVPLCMMLVSVAGLYVAWPFVKLIDLIGKGIGLATGIAPITMGIIISASMGLLLTLPTSSAAIWVAIATATASSVAIANGNTDPNMLLAGGAAVVGCSAHMIGFAVASFRENKFSGLISQGIGTSMLQIPNLMRKPIIFVPQIISSIIVGPLATTVLKLYCTSTGGGMGTSGLVGVFGAIEASQYMGLTSAQIGIRITLLMFVLPAAISFIVSEILRKSKLIKNGDQLLEK